MNQEPLIEFSNVTLGYGSRPVLHNVSFAIYQGDFFGLVGPNGAGKTTLLRAMLGVIRPLGGSVAVQSEATGIRFGYVPQRNVADHTLPFTVFEVVMMGRFREIGLLHRPGPADREAVLLSLRHVDIEGLKDFSFKSLSGGQKQRVLIARAMASHPDVLILDEPTNGMDLSSRTSILGLIHSLHARNNLTIIMVTHLLDDIANYVKRIAIVDKNTFQVGGVEEILTGENLTALYQMPVTVTSVHGWKLIRPRSTDAAE